MLQELKSMFEKQAGVERFDLIQTFHACKQEDSKRVSAYLLKMKDYVEQLECLGYVLPQDLSKRNCPVYLDELLKKKKQVGTASSLDNYHYAPSITRGVVSVHRLAENRYVQCFTDYGILVSKNDILYFNAIPRDGIYENDIHNLVLNVNSICNVNNKRAKHNLDSTYLWHYLLAHISKKHIEKLQLEGLLKSTDDDSFDKCVSCL
ncbi:retrotransposon protein, putative, ty1-copia subclass [Tanacetum coccineum]|uniref:Retrotransposon protein, putative, ty1-copia subclass n=1 Tax=Tanacetum coccineum TaxID=301880 RepID=A0ABQ5GS02_9ASTR